MLYLFEGRVSTKLFGIFLHRTFVYFLPFIYLFKYLFISVWIYKYYFILGYNPILLHCSTCVIFGH